MDGKELKLISPIVDAEPAVYTWPLKKSKDYDQAFEIINTINWVGCEDVNLRSVVARNVLVDYDITSYDSMKSLCERFNKAVETAQPLWDGQPRHSRVGIADDDKLLRHIITQSYNRAVTNPEKLNKYAPFSPGVYGETSYDLVKKMIETVKPDKDKKDIFIDLGSGVGQVVAQVAASSSGIKCYGIELEEAPCNFAANFKTEFILWMKWYGKSFGQFELLSGDFLDERFRKLIRSATIIFVNNYAFGPTVDQRLKHIFEDLEHGVRIISSKEFCRLEKPVSERRMTDIGSMMDVKLLSEPHKDNVSWTDKAVPYYMHCINRGKLELYFENKHSSSREDSGSNSGREDAGSDGGGSVSRKIRRHRHKVRMRDSGNDTPPRSESVSSSRASSNGVIDDIDEETSKPFTAEDYATNFGPTTRRQWNTWVNTQEQVKKELERQRKGAGVSIKTGKRSSHLQSHHQSFSIVAASSSPSRPMSVASDSSKEAATGGSVAGGSGGSSNKPIVTIIAKTNPVRKSSHESAARRTKLKYSKHQKRRGDSKTDSLSGSGKSSSSGEKFAIPSSKHSEFMAHLDLLHGEGVKAAATSHQGPPPDGCSPVSMDSLKSPQRRRSSPVPSTGLLTAEQTTGLDEHMLKLRQQYEALLIEMVRPEFREAVLDDIKREKAKNDELLKRKVIMEQQIKQLQVNGTDLLKYQMNHLNIRADNPGELLNEAKDIVMRHKELEQRASAIQSEINALELQNQQLLAMCQEKDEHLFRSGALQKLGLSNCSSVEQAKHHILDEICEHFKQRKNLLQTSDLMTAEIEREENLLREISGAVAVMPHSKERSTIGLDTSAVVPKPTRGRGRPPSVKKLAAKQLQQQPSMPTVNFVTAAGVCTPGQTASTLAAAAAVAAASGEDDVEKKIQDIVRKALSVDSEAKMRAESERRHKATARRKERSQRLQATKAAIEAGILPPPKLDDGSALANTICEVAHGNVGNEMNVQNVKAMFSAAGLVPVFPAGGLSDSAEMTRSDIGDIDGDKSLIDSNSGAASVISGGTRSADSVSPKLSWTLSVGEAGSAVEIADGQGHSSSLSQTTSIVKTVANVDMSERLVSNVAANLEAVHLNDCDNIGDNGLDDESPGKRPNSVPVSMISQLTAKKGRRKKSAFSVESLIGGNDGDVIRQGQFVSGSRSESGTPLVLLPLQSHSDRSFDDRTIPLPQRRISHDSGNSTSTTDTATSETRNDDDVTSSAVNTKVITEPTNISGEQINASASSSNDGQSGNPHDHSNPGNPFGNNAEMALMHQKMAARLGDNRSSGSSSNTGNAGNPHDFSNPGNPQSRGGESENIFDSFSSVGKKEKQSQQQQPRSPAAATMTQSLADLFPQESSNVKSLKLDSFRIPRNRKAAETNDQSSVVDRSQPDSTLVQQYDSYSSSKPSSSSFNPVSPLVVLDNELASKSKSSYRLWNDRNSKPVNLSHRPPPPLGSLLLDRSKAPQKLLNIAPDKPIIKTLSRKSLEEYNYSKSAAGRFETLGVYSGGSGTKSPTVSGDGVMESILSQKIKSGGRMDSVAIMRSRQLVMHGKIDSDNDGSANLGPKTPPGTPPASSHSGASAVRATSPQPLGGDPFDEDDFDTNLFPTPPRMQRVNYERFEESLLKPIDESSHSGESKRIDTGPKKDVHKRVVVKPEMIQVRHHIKVENSEIPVQPSANERIHAEPTPVVIKSEDVIPVLASSSSADSRPVINQLSNGAILDNISKMTNVDVKLLQSLIKPEVLQTLHSLEPAVLMTSLTALLGSLAQALAQKPLGSGGTQGGSITGANTAPPPTFVPVSLPMPVNCQISSNWKADPVHDTVDDPIAMDVASSSGDDDGHNSGANLWIDANKFQQKRKSAVNVRHERVIKADKMASSMSSNTSTQSTDCQSSSKNRRKTRRVSVSSMSSGSVRQVTKRRKRINKISSERSRKSKRPTTTGDQKRKKGRKSRCVDVSSGGNESSSSSVEIIRDSGHKVRKSHRSSKSTLPAPPALPPVSLPNNDDVTDKLLVSFQNAITSQFGQIVAAVASSPRKPSELVQLPITPPLPHSDEISNTAGNLPDFSRPPPPPVPQSQDASLTDDQKIVNAMNQMVLLLTGAGSMKKQQELVDNLAQLSDPLTIIKHVTDDHSVISAPLQYTSKPNGSNIERIVYDYTSLVTTPTKSTSACLIDSVLPLPLPDPKLVPPGPLYYSRSSSCETRKSLLPTPALLPDVKTVSSKPDHNSKSGVLLSSPGLYISRRDMLQNTGSVGYDELSRDTLQQGDDINRNRIKYPNSSGVSNRRHKEGNS